MGVPHLPIAGGPTCSLPSAPQPQPYSPDTAAKTSRLRGAAVTQSVYPYCAVGCGQLIYTKAGKLIDREGDPRYCCVTAFAVGGAALGLIGAALALVGGLVARHALVMLPQSPDFS